jgi:hypothetical protein
MYATSNHLQTLDSFILITHTIINFRRTYATYLSIFTSIWRTRKENLRIGDLKNMIIRKLIDYRKFKKLISNQKFEKLSEELSVLDINILINL